MVFVIFLSIGRV